MLFHFPPRKFCHDMPYLLCSFKSFVLLELTKLNLTFGNKVYCIARCMCCFCGLNSRKLIALRKVITPLPNSSLNTACWMGICIILRNQRTVDLEFLSCVLIVLTQRLLYRPYFILINLELRTEIILNVIKKEVLRSTGKCLCTPIRKKSEKKKKISATDIG